MRILQPVAQWSGGWHSIQAAARVSRTIRLTTVAGMCTRAVAKLTIISSYVYFSPRRHAHATVIAITSVSRCVCHTSAPRLNDSIRRNAWPIRHL